MIKKKDYKRMALILRSAYKTNGRMVIDDWFLARKAYRKDRRFKAYVNSFGRK